MTRAGVQATCIPEVLGLIGQQTLNRKTLYNACLVSRTFNAAFSQHLYRVMRWDHRNIAYLVDDVKRRRLFRDGKTERFTRTLIVTYSAVRYVIKFGTRNPRDTEGYAYALVCTAITDLCQHSHRLRAFASQVALTHQCLKALSLLPYLESVSIDFPRDFEIFLGFDEGRTDESHDYPSRMTEYGHPWKYLAFTNLRKLSLLHLFGDVNAWKPWILQVMLDSPRLEHLSLDISRDTCGRLDSLDAHGAKQIFSWVAKEYNGRKGYGPRLKTLRLGGGVRIPHNVDRLLDLGELNEISVFEHIGVFSPSRDQMHLLPDLLSSAGIAPNLGKVCVNPLRNHDYQTLQARAATQKAAPALKLAELMLTTAKGANLSQFQIWQHLQDLGASQILLPRSAWRRGEDVDEQTRWRELARFTSITDLILELDSGNRMENHLFATSCSSLQPLASLRNLWIVPLPIPRISHLFPLAHQAADVLPALQYVRVGNRAWRIHRRANCEPGTTLEPLDEWEDEVEGPAFFHSPGPLPWGYHVQHFDL